MHIKLPCTQHCCTERPFGENSPKGMLTYPSEQELLRTTTVTDATYAALERHVGHTGVVELVSIIGYYTYVAYTLGAFRIPPPSAVAPHATD